MSLTRVNLNRDLLKEAEPARFLGEWTPGEPEGWETFTVMLHGAEAGELIEATVGDLVEVLNTEGLLVVGGGEGWNPDDLVYSYFHNVEFATLCRRIFDVFDAVVTNQGDTP